MWIGRLSVWPSMRTTQSSVDGISAETSLSVCASLSRLPCAAGFRSADPVSNRMSVGTTKRSPMTRMSPRAPSTSRSLPKNSERYFSSWLTLLASARFSCAPRSAIFASLSLTLALARSSAAESFASCSRTAASCRLSSSACAADWALRSVAATRSFFEVSSCVERLATSRSSCNLSSVSAAMSALSFAASALASSNCDLIASRSDVAVPSDADSSVVLACRSRLAPSASDSVFDSCAICALSCASASFLPAMVCDSTN